MNKITAIHILIIVQIIFLKDVCETIPGLEENLFHDINEQLQVTVNKVFTCLKLDKTFSTKQTNKHLLTMNAIIKNIAEKNYKIYKKIQKASKCDRGTPKPGLFNLMKPLEEIKKEYFIENKIVETVNKTALNITMSTLEIPDNSEETILILRKYFNENNVSLDTEALTNNTKFMYDKQGSYRCVRKIDFKAWHPSNLSELFETRRVYRGRSVKIKRFPFVVSIHVLGEFVCTGSIISREMIITAATCVQVALNNKNYIHEHPSGIVIRVGSDYTDRSGELVYASNIFFHPMFELDTLRDNLAIIQMKKFLDLRKNNKIRRIDYVPGNQHPSEDIKEITLIGFGDEDVETAEEMVQLTFSRLSLYDNNNCADVYTRKYVSNKNFCAGFVKKSSGACQRDVGGPAIVSSILVGIVSFGPPVCGTPDAPTVFTDIRHYIKWINKIVRGNSAIQLSTTPTHLREDKMRTTIRKSKFNDHGQLVNKPKIIYDVPQVEPPAQHVPVQKPTEISKLPKTIQLLTDILKQFMTPDYIYGENEFDDINPDTHLWSPTTTNPLDHPLLNKSLFFIDAMKTKKHVEYFSPSFNMTDLRNYKTYHKYRTTPEFKIDKINNNMMAPYNLPENPLLLRDYNHEANRYSSDDNYESVSYEEGLSIESPTQHLLTLDHHFSIKPRYKMPTPTTSALPPITLPRNKLHNTTVEHFSERWSRLDFEIMEDKADRFLKKYFIRDYNIQGDDDRSNDVLGITTERHKKYKINNYDHNTYKETKIQQHSIKSTQFKHKLNRGFTRSRFLKNYPIVNNPHNIMNNNYRSRLEGPKLSKSIRNYGLERLNQSTMYIDLTPIEMNILLNNNDFTKNKIANHKLNNQINENKNLNKIALNIIKKKSNLVKNVPLENVKLSRVVDEINDSLEEMNETYDVELKDKSNDTENFEWTDLSNGYNNTSSIVNKAGIKESEDFNIDSETSVTETKTYDPNLLAYIDMS